MVALMPAKLSPPEAALLQLAKLVASDLNRGRASSGLQNVGLALSGNSEAVQILLNLLLAEASKKRPSNRLIDAFLFMVGQALSEARMVIDANPHAQAETLVAELRQSLAAAAKAGRIPPELLMAVAQQFAAAKLDLGEELRSVVHMHSERAASHGPELDPNDIAAHYAALAEALDHDPFLLQAQLSEQLAAFADEQKSLITASLVTTDVPAMREAAVGWLLDPSAGVSRRVAQTLAHAAAEGLVSAASADRMVLMRPWVPEPVQASIDVAVRACRQRGKLPAPHLSLQVSAVIASGCDGAGAQSFFVLLKRGRKLALASLLVKHGFGVRDAWVRDGLSQREAAQFVAEIAHELDPFDASLEIVQAAIAHGLAANLGKGEAPPFGLVQFLEVVGLTQVRPERLAPAALMAELLEEVPAEQKSAKAVARALTASKRWSQQYAFVQSWFEQGEAAQTLVSASGSKKEKQDAVLREILPARRARWAELLAWTARAAQDQVEDDDWIDLALVAQELLGGRPLAGIPVAAWIASNTVAALSSR
ncbi:truncated hemoglobin YjbI [Methylobacterium sp. BE186]|uniref:hypothetical protein n=1 Tax=Methylobacterium sp. BE186 TaxID=2817715 RepID=UPI0028557672|nr:hypothetical protein [Methylobacterium sp. BE186]MDR7040313.1 truncated hemoglobin YjbI [Methylobacterium sp. BE186]